MGYTRSLRTHARMEELPGLPDLGANTLGDNQNYYSDSSSGIMNDSYRPGSVSVDLHDDNAPMQYSPSAPQALGNTPRLSNPFNDEGVANTARDVGMDPQLMGTTADTALANENPSSYVNPLANGAEEASGIGGYAMAGVQAAATTAQMLAQAAQAQSQREFGAQQNDLNRALQTKLTQMNINESKYEANLNAKSNAYKMMLSAINSNINATLGGVQNVRNAAQGFDSLLSQAFLR
jgi:hypothetical protein